MSDLYSSGAGANDNVSPKCLAKMSFIYNALENGWTVKKNNDSYVFTKKHEGKKEMFSEDDEFRLVPHKRKLLDGKYVSVQPEEEFVIGDCTFIEIAKPTPQALRLLKQRQLSLS